MNKKFESKSEGLITFCDNKRPSVKVAYWIMFAILLLASIIALLPIIWTGLAGFKGLDEYYSTTPNFLPNKIEWSKLAKVWNEASLTRSFVNSIFMFAGCWVSEIFIGGIAGYTISRLKPKGSSLLFTLMMWTMMMPNTVSLVPLFLTWTHFPIFHWNFQNTYVPFYVGAMSDVFNILLFKNFFDTIPMSYIESAKLDGCSNIGIFTKIIVPLSKPIVATISIFVFNGTWNNFLMPFLLIKNDNLATVALKLYTLKSSWIEPEQMLASFLVLIPPILVFLIYSKQILGSNTSVGVKE